jgi:hypothetical protein
MSMPEQFNQDGYLILKNVIPQDICRIVTKYALLQEQIAFNPEVGNTAQVENAHSIYADTLMETLMQFLQPHLEKNTGLKLCPTYTYFRVYRPGMALQRHKDRPSCEISTTICFGHNYKTTDPSYNWGMYVDKESRSVEGPAGTFKSAENSGMLVNQQPGDLIVYRGCEVEHWRDAFQAEYGSYQIQAFFHYIDKNGPYYPEYAFDKRPGLGFRHK